MDEQKGILNGCGSVVIVFFVFLFIGWGFLSFGSLILAALVVSLSSVILSLIGVIPIVGQYFYSSVALPVLNFAFSVVGVDGNLPLQGNLISFFVGVNNWFASNVRVLGFAYIDTPRIISLPYIWGYSGSFSVSISVLSVLIRLLIRR